MTLKPILRNPGSKSRGADILLGLGLTILVAFLFFLPLGFFETIHYKFYDLSLRMRGTLPASKDVTLVAIDDPSVAAIGRWPWPRAKIAELIDRLREGGAKLIAFDIVFPPAEAERAAGNDRLLGEATRRAGNILYPFYFSLGSSKKEGPESPSQIMTSSFLLFDDPRKFSDFPPPSASKVFASVPEIAQGAKAAGHINVLPDGDGKVRWDPLIVEFAGHYYPSFSLQIATAAMGLTRGEIKVNVGNSIRLGTRTISTNHQGMMLINYYGGNQTFAHHSCADVLAGKLPAETFKGKVVLVGVTAAGIAAGVQDLMATPFSNQFPGVEKHAQEVASILENRFISRPDWAPFGEFGLVLLFGVGLAFFMPRQRPARQLIFALALLLILGGIMFGAIHKGIWIRIFFPGFLVVLQYLLATARRAPQPEKEATAEMGVTGTVGLGEKRLAGSQGMARQEAGGPIQKIGRYEILGELGHGAMGVVYKGRDPVIDRLVAIKTIRFDRLYEAQEIESLKERFFKEAQAAGRLTHPGIVTIYDVADDGGISYMAMEFVEGESLSQYATQERLLPVKEVLRIVIEAAEALDFAHQRGIVHRDIKPANIMRTSGGEVKVMDFGIAKLPSSTITQTGSILGTPTYMSPEQITGQELDGRSDLFSLGCVFYELLTGTKPFIGSTLSTLMYQITQGESRPPSEHNPAVPPSLDEVMDRALAKSPPNRFQSGKEMAGALKRLLEEIS